MHEMTVSGERLVEVLMGVLRRRSGLGEQEYAQETVRLGHRPGTKWLADLSGVSQRTLGRILSGEIERPSVWVADRLLAGTGVPALALEDLSQAPVWEAWEVGFSDDCVHVPA